LSKAWIKERKREYYYRKAKKEKYRSRAAYKLIQAIEKHKFLKAGDVVVDLGAAPGGWIQVSSEVVGLRGYVLGLDPRRIESFKLSNIQILTGDVNDPRMINIIKKFLPRPADVVLSDVSPNISGIWELDHCRQIDLAKKSLVIARSVLRSKGNFFVKVFQGEVLGDFLKETKQYFEFVKLVKPKASRSKSAEIYMLGMGLRSNYNSFLNQPV
jgi:23S rRNA (uridine2552-2'-O)-methyltransferase